MIDAAAAGGVAALHDVIAGSSSVTARDVGERTAG